MSLFHIGEIVVLSILVACHFLIPVFLWIGFYKAVSVSVKVHRFAAPILCYLFAFQVVYCVASVWLMCAAFWITCELSLLFLFFYQVLKKQKTHISDVDVVNVDSSNDLRKPGHSILRKPRNTSGNNSKFDTFENNSHSNSLRNTSGNNFKSDTIDSHSNGLQSTSGHNSKSTHRDGSSKFNERNSQVNSTVLMVSVLKQQILPKSAKSVTYVWERGNEA
uniref:Uncharacterized protein n=1 Tax=Cacopsylla melanoneura TaxID=428564 RepID=A0A8D8R1Z1_9HEMI